MQNMILLPDLDRPFNQPLPVVGTSSHQIVDGPLRQRLSGFEQHVDNLR
jgi:hypothetical protein